MCSPLQTPFALQGISLTNLVRKQVIVLLCGCIVALMFGLPIFGATLTVSNTSDSGSGSLRQTILDAASGDVVNFSVTGKIILTSGQLTLNKNLTITGPGAAQLTVSGNKASRIFLVQAGFRVVVEGLTIADGVGNLGGGIYNSPGANLTINKCVVSGNQATVTDGGLSNEGRAVVTNSTIVANAAKTGGGIGNNGVLTITSCTISGNNASNYGGGIDNNGDGNLTLANSTITNNFASKSGGGVNNFGAFAVKSTIIARNSAPAAIDLKGEVNLQGHNLIGNAAGSTLNNDTGTNLLNVDPRLMGLSYHGGSVPTHALFPDSPAIDQGISSGDPDQRGVLRPNDLPNVDNAIAGDGTDIGAFEGVVSDFGMSNQKAGSVLVFPYYSSKLATRADTRITISNISGLDTIPTATATIHLYFIDSISCESIEAYFCLRANTSIALKCSETDPETIGSLLAVVVDSQGNPIQNNVLIGNAYIDESEYGGNYSAEAFAANSATVATVTAGKATLYFNGVGYDAVPNQFALEILSPAEVAGQRLLAVGLSGDLTSKQLAGAGQIGAGQIFNGNQLPNATFNNFLIERCLSIATFSATNPRLTPSIGTLLPIGQIGTMKINVGSAVGLLMTPRKSKWYGIRSLQKTNTTATTLIIPISSPRC